MLGSGHHMPGYEAPLYHALVDPILLGGAPRTFAIVNGTLAAAIGLGLQQWVTGVLFWAVGHSFAVLAAKRDPEFLSILIRHLRHRGFLSC